MSEFGDGVYPLEGRVLVDGLDPVEGRVDGREPVEGRVDGWVPVDGRDPVEGRVEGWVPVDGRVAVAGRSAFDQLPLSRRSQLPLSLRR